MDELGIEKRLLMRLEREASRRNGAYDHYGMGNTPASVDPEVFEAIQEITRLRAALQAAGGKPDE